jgi:hypothetical protein
MERTSESTKKRIEETKVQDRQTEKPQRERVETLAL